MKKFLGFLFLLFLLVSLVYAASTMYVCEKSTINLRPLGIDYSCVCAGVKGSHHMVCEKNQ